MAKERKNDPVDVKVGDRVRARDGRSGVVQYFKSDMRNPQGVVAVSLDPDANRARARVRVEDIGPGREWEVV